MRVSVMDLPFKTSQKTIVIFKDLPVLRCKGCGEYLLENQVMERVQAIIYAVSLGTQSELAEYAA